MAENTWVTLKINGWFRCFISFWGNLGLFSGANSFREGIPSSTQEFWGLKDVQAFWTAKKNMSTKMHTRSIGLCFVGAIFHISFQQKTDPNVRRFPLKRISQIFVAVSQETIPLGWLFPSHVSPEKIGSPNKKGTCSTGYIHPGKHDYWLWKNSQLKRYCLLKVVIFYCHLIFRWSICLCNRRSFFERIYTDVVATFCWGHLRGWKKNANGWGKTLTGWRLFSLPNRLFTIGWLPGTRWPSIEINGCCNWMIQNLYIGNGCFTKHPFKTGCLGFQVDVSNHFNHSWGWRIFHPSHEKRNIGFQRRKGKRQLCLCRHLTPSTHTTAFVAPNEQRYHTSQYKLSQ